MWLFLIFVAVPILEIALFIQVGGWLGLFPTLLIVVLTALIGTHLVRSQGLAELTRLQKSLSTLENPAEPLAHGAMILVAGVLLLTPGFFTDALGFSFLIPSVRTAWIKAIVARLNVQTVHHTTQEPEEMIDITPKDARDTASGWTRK